MRNQSHMFEFIGVGEIAETTTQLLSFSLNESWSPDKGKPGINEVEQLVFQQARDYLSEVREGFVLSVRAAEIPDSYQLRYLLDRVLLDWDSLGDELGLAVDEDKAKSTDSQPSDAPGLNAPGPTTAHNDTLDEEEPLEPVRKQLLAFGMAAVALGALPKLPAEQVTFPRSYGNPPTYADISAPSSPAEMLVRIEELEEMIWQMMAGSPGKLVQNNYGPVRRTYGFFETSAWLARNEAERFGFKKNGSSGLTFF